jgi:hypothetical protein
MISDLLIVAGQPRFTWNADIGDPFHVEGPRAEDTRGPSTLG